MNNEALFRLLGDMDETYVTGAEQPMKRRNPLRLWLPAAVCAAALLVAVPLLRPGRSNTPALHSYTLSENGGITADTTQTGPVTGAGVGDEDQAMTAEELREAMLEAGFSEADAGAFSTGDHAMTWSQWWKFCHSYDAGERTLEALTEFAEAQGHATGELPGGALEADPGVPAQQEAIDAYQRLMERFEADFGPDAYPDWYGGAYIVNGNFLIVNITHRVEETLTDKDFYLQIQAGAGSSSVGFGGVKYSLNELRDLQAQISALPELQALSAWGCGVDQQAGQVFLELPEADEALLAALAVLDPEDDAIRVSVGFAAATDGADIVAITD